VERKPSPAKNRRICAIRAASIRASRIGLPISSVMSCAICSTRRSIASAARRSTAPRCAAAIADQAGKAAAAAATARSTSSVPDEGNSPIVSDGCNGPCFSYVSPEALGCHSPPM
jgi:hypothetical protein